jgi:hypothetical protein
MTALLLLCGLLPAQAGSLTFNTVAAMEAYKTSTTGVTSITVLGYAAIGDMGRALYVPASGNISSLSMLVQTGDGAYWMVNNSILRPEMFGGFPDGATNCVNALNTALMYGKPIHHRTRQGCHGHQYRQLHRRNVDQLFHHPGSNADFMHTLPFLHRAAQPQR